MPPNPPRARQPGEERTLEHCELDGGPLCGEPRCPCIDKALAELPAVAPPPPPAAREPETPDLSVMEEGHKLTGAYIREHFVDEDDAQPAAPTTEIEAELRARIDERIAATEGADLDATSFWDEEGTLISRRELLQVRAILRAADRTAEYAGLLRKATTRLEILRDRMAGCDDETKSDRHELSRWEIDGWIEEQRAALPTEER